MNSYRQKDMGEKFFAKKIYNLLKKEVDFDVVT